MKLKCNDKVWRQFINGVCQDCMKRVEGDLFAHTCKRLDEFPTRSLAEAISRPVGILSKQPLEDMPEANRRIFAKANKFMNYGKKV